MPEELRKVSLAGNLKLSEGNFYLSFFRDFNFKPGQVIGITTDPRLEPRLYSLAGSDTDPYAHILYSVKEDGELTPLLAALEQGDKIWVSNPQGNFLHHELPSWWISSGTGIAPFLSWLRSGLCAPEKLIFGARDNASLHFADELQTFLGERLIPCLSRRVENDAFHGRVSDYLAQLNSIPADKVFFLCGVAEMVIDVREILIGRGIDPRQIHAEIYF